MKIGILVVHGMGSQNPRFADGFIKEMNGRLSKLGVAAGSVVWEAAYWADILEPRERALLKALTKGNDLDWIKLRRFIINALADAVAYRPLDGAAVGVYESIHERIRDHLGTLRANAGGADVPLVVIAHSLGSVMLSNYVWDEQTNAPAKRLGRNPFERAQTLSGMVTFGSNIPLFTLAYDKVDAIAFPAKGLPSAVAAAARWFNFYDPDDVLGYPLKPLSDSYRNAVDKDIAVNVGGLLTSWNPISHDEYWEDDDFTKPVAKLVASLALLP